MGLIKFVLKANYYIFFILVISLVITLILYVVGIFKPLYLIANIVGIFPVYAYAIILVSFMMIVKRDMSIKKKD